MTEEKIESADKLTRQVQEQRNLLNTDRLDLSFGEIMSMYERNEIIVKPAFQRYFRWTDEQKTRFIESILLGIPIPPIFVAEDGNGVWELVDGLQRISTVLSFFGILKDQDSERSKKNDWELLAGERVESLDGFSYATLPNPFRLNIKRATCRVEILRWNSSYDMRFELFNRLNTGGSPLTQQEIRNCIYRDISPKFNEFLEQLVANQDFSKLVALNEAQKDQLYDQELALRFLSLYKKEPSQIKTSIAQHMTNFMKAALESDNFDYDQYRKIFNELFALLNPCGKDIFRQTDGKFATTLYDVITIGVAEHLDLYQGNPSLITKKIEEVRSEKPLQSRGNNRGNNQRSRIIHRLNAAKRIFGSR